MTLPSRKRSRSEFVLFEAKPLSFQSDVMTSNRRELTNPFYASDDAKERDLAKKDLADVLQWSFIRTIDYIAEPIQAAGQSPGFFTVLLMPVTEGAGAGTGVSCDVEFMVKVRSRRRDLNVLHRRWTR